MLYLCKLDSNNCRFNDKNKYVGPKNINIEAGDISEGNVLAALKTALVYTE